MPASRAGSAGAPTGDPTELPVWLATGDTRWYRIHRSRRGPCWFASDGRGRFDLQPPNGSCYVAELPLGAFIETFDGVSLLPQDDIDERVLSTVTMDRELRLADCTHRLARAFGVDAAISVGTDYARTQRFAAWLHAAGFDGVRYLLRNDPSAMLVGIALFGEAGEQQWPAAETAAIPADVIEHAEAEFAITVVPIP